LFGSLSSQDDESKAGIYSRPCTLSCHPGCVFAISLFVNSHLFVPLSELQVSRSCTSSERPVRDVPLNQFDHRNFERRKIAGKTTTAIARICSQFMADFLQLWQRIRHNGKIVPQ
jgi:hypothetical protein